MTFTVSELTWIKQILADLTINVKEPMMIFYDNQSTIHIVIILVFHKHTKHIEVDCHFIKKVQLKEIETPFVKSWDQLTDILTKGLSVKTFENISYKLGLYDLYNSRLRESVKK
jgi:hypothetical protein